MRENPLHTKEISQIIARQRGHITRAQLLAGGLKPAWVERHLAGGELIAVHAGVYAVGHVPRHALARAGAAVLACGPGALVSHMTAAALWGVAEWPAMLEVTTPRERRRPGIWTHRSSTLRSPDAVSHQGIRITSPGRTALDLQSRMPDARLTRLVQDLRVAGHLGPTAFGQLCARSVRIGRLLGDAERPSRSVLEDRFRAFLGEHGLPSPEFNARLPGSGREVDALYREAGLIVELDSWQHHQHRSSFERDRELDERAADEGYLTIRLTHRRLDERAATTAARIGRILDRSPGR